MSYRYFNLILPTTPRIIQLSSTGQAQRQIGSVSSRRQGDSQDVRTEVTTQNSIDVSLSQEELALETSEIATTKSAGFVTDVVSESVTTMDLRNSAQKPACKLALRLRVDWER